MLRVRRGKLPLLAAAVAGAIPTFGFGQTANWTFTGALGTWTGTWNVNLNWNPPTAFPNSTTAVANFPVAALITGASGGPGTVIINNAPITVNRINFVPTGTNSNSYTVTGVGSLASLNVVNGGTIDVSAAGSLNAGVATISANVLTPAGSTIYKTGTGNLVLSGANNFGGGSGVNGLSVNGGTLVAMGANSLAGLSIISTASTGVLELQGATINAIAGVGSAFQPDKGMVHAMGNNTWNGNWFGTASGASAGVDAASTLTVNGGLFDGTDTNTNGFSKVGGTGTMIVNNMALNGPLTVSAGTLKMKAGGGNAGTSKVGGLAVSGTGKLDVADHSFIVDYTGASPNASIRAALLAGRGGPGLGNETWAGNGINSSTVATAVGLGDLSYAVGYADNAALPLGPYASFGGVPVDDSSILIKYTWAADADLNGKVDDDDVTLVGAFYGTPGDWSLGDFDYDGIIGDDDVTLLGALYNPAGAPLSVTMLASLYGDDFAAAFQKGLNNSLVPEPSCIGLLGMGGLMLARRRRSAK